jgi:cytochrome c oxidase subunit 1
VDSRSIIETKAASALTAYTKAWVRRLLMFSILDFIIAGTIALFMRTDQANAFFILGPIGSPGTLGQLETAHGLGMFVGWQFPFTYALSMYIIPKYMKRRIFNERLLPAMFYTFFAGFYLIWLAALYGFGAGWYFLFPLPVLGGPGASSPWSWASSATFFVGLIIVNISLIIFAIAVFGTVFSSKYGDRYDKAPGMNTSFTARLATSLGFDAYMPSYIRNKIVKLPLAVVGVMVTTFAMIISVPPFFVLLYDGLWTSFSNPSFLTNLIAKNFLWINYHPIVYFAFFPLVGMYYTLLPIFAKRNFESARWTRAPWPLLMIPSIGVYSHHIFMDTSQPFALQLMSTYMTMIIAVGSAISIFTLMGLLWFSRFNWNLTAKWIMAGILGWTLGGVIGVQLGNPAFNVYGHNTYMVLAHFHYNALCGIVLAGFGFVYWAIPELANRKWYSDKLGEIHFWGTSIAAFGMVTDFAAMGYLGVPRREFIPMVPVLPFTDMYSPYLIIAVTFAFAIAIFQIPFIINAIMTFKTKPAASDEVTVYPTPEMITREGKIDQESVYSSM